MQLLPWKTWGADFLIASRGLRLTSAAGHGLLKLKPGTISAV